jgi:hypothetical protein
VVEALTKGGLSMDTALKLVDYLTLAAVVLGPILAVQAQKWVEDFRDKKSRRVRIFQALMATRAANLSPVHVEALNAIPVEFYGKRAFKEIVSAWKTYLDHLSQKDMEPGLWANTRQEYFIELLWRLASALGYKFDKLELKRGIYYPTGHANLEAEQEVIRKGLFRIFSGQAAFPLDIKTFPVDGEALEKQKQLQALLVQWLNGGVTVKVDVGQQGKAEAVPFALNPVEAKPVNAP